MTATMTEDAIDELFYPGSKQKRREKQAAPVEEDWRDDYSEKWIGGRLVRLYTVGSLAKALGVTSQTVRKWTKKAYIPQEPYRLPKNMVIRGQLSDGRRLYTQDFIEAVVEVMERHDMLGKSRVFWSKHPEITIEIIDTYKRAKRRTADA